MWEEIKPEDNRGSDNIYINFIYKIDDDYPISISTTRDGSMIKHRNNLGLYVAIVQSKNKMFKKYLYNDDLEVLKMQARIIAGNFGWSI